MSFSTITSFIAATILSAFAGGVGIGKWALTVPLLTMRSGIVIGVIVFLLLFAFVIVDNMPITQATMLFGILIEGSTSTFLIGTILGYCWQLNGLGKQRKQND